MKVCVITGASNGIGYKLAQDFKDNGYQVINLDKVSNKVDGIDFIKTDLKNINNIKSSFELIKDKYKKAHVLINNAAISKFSKSILETTNEDLDNVIDINLKGAYLCAQEFIKLNNDETYGRIINISSTRHHQNEANWELYGMSKGGIVSLTNSLCISLSDTPITVNTISPGWIEIQDYDHLSNEEHLLHPSRRVGKPKDISNVCLFLANEENDFINGANIVVDGGVHLKMQY